MSPGNFFLIGCLIKAIKGLQGHKIRLLVLLSWPDNLTRKKDDGDKDTRTRLG